MGQEGATAPETSNPISADDRSNAMLAHVLTIFAGFVAAGVIFLVKRRDSRFVAFHALQAFFWHLLLFVGMFAGFITFFVVMVTTSGFADGPKPPASSAGPPAMVFVGFFGIWALMMLSWMLHVGFCVYLAMQASSGRWARYPIVGSLVQRFGRYEPTSFESRPTS